MQTYLCLKYQGMQTSLCLKYHTDLPRTAAYINKSYEVKIPFKLSYEVDELLHLVLHSIFLDRSFQNVT